jgi:hypothetical protein
MRGKRDAKRLEWAEVAGVLVKRGRAENGSKLHALQTLRAICRATL